MNEENKYIEEQEESSIDFMKMFNDLLKHKKLYFKVLPITFVLSCIYLLSLPNYYTCTVKLAPEMNGGSRTNSLLNLASSFGMNLGGGAGVSTEALYPWLYPEVMNSVDFKVGLFPVNVTIEPEEEGDPVRQMHYFDYLINEQKSPWWSKAIGGAVKAVFGLIFHQDSVPEPKDVNSFRLTRKQAGVVKALDRLVVCDVDKKTMVITINVTDQNALVCATMADSVKSHLQEFITNYRTSKAKKDLQFYSKIEDEHRNLYEKVRQEYSEYMDANNDVILNTVRQKQTDLENEMQLQYNAYSQSAQQRLAAEAKVQEETPAFTTLQNATVPVLKAGPHRAKSALVFLFLAFMGTSAWILYKEGDLKQLLGLS
ncbi:MAG: chain-length determining protein [Bacteroidaceae bacterium]|nr:chain-length determining protein [Bacteroidaceae bacterium]